MYVLDSSAIIEIMRETQKGKKVLAKIGESKLLSTAIAMHELFSGADERNKFILKEFFKNGEILNFTYEDSEISGSVERALIDKGEIINKLDTLIAGICINHDAVLVTFDNDFKRISELKILEI